MTLKLLGAVCLACLCSQVFGQTTEHNLPPLTGQLEKKLLLADKDKLGNISLEKIKTLEDMLTEEEDDLMYPADDLYGDNWDTRWVNPFQTDKADLVYPDSAVVDCSSFRMPIHEATVRVTSPYGPRHRRMHRGIDLKVQIGDTIYAAFAGKVRIRNTERRGYGKYLVIRHPNGLETVYGHLSAWLVDTNQIVRAGQPIALGGSTGRSTGPHLHFETRFLGQSINPADFINFKEEKPYKPVYTLRNIAFNGKYTNIYTPTNEQILFHVVRRGETLGAIARHYGTSVKALCLLNHIRSNTRLRIGQSLRCGVGVAG
ncbi:MAG: peptidoglycan DD-metalloendopeptidase family protein [Tannerella sp.]|nr:peptidoglycan DD-metalloendopeptidase family protein [Tannerella sp.]